MDLISVNFKPNGCHGLINFLLLLLLLLLHFSSSHANLFTFCSLTSSSANQRAPSIVTSSRRWRQGQAVVIVREILLSLRKTTSYSVISFQHHANTLTDHLTDHGATQGTNRHVSGGKIYLIQGFLRIFFPCLLLGRSSTHLWPTIIIYQGSVCIYLVV